jgi:DNA-binding MarR family transcriptional regulator
MPSPHTLSQAIDAWTHVFMRRSMSDFMRYARDSRVSMQQFGALFHLHRKGMAGVSDVGDDLGVTSAAASQMIDRLVLLGLLERSEDPHDRRGKQIVLSVRGKELVEGSLQARQKWVDELARVISPEQQEDIIASLELLTQAAREIDLETAKE